MALSWNEIKDRALSFSNDWKDETREQAEAHTFWDEFFRIFGINRRRVATFEKKVTTSTRKNGRIDLLWKGNILVEHKSLGADLNKAHKQAIDYFPGLEEKDLPKLIIVCDFQNFRVFNLDKNKVYNFTLKELYKNVTLFDFIAGYNHKQKLKEEDPVNIHAAELMGRIHDQLKESGYTGHNLEVYLVRLLFCLFADDTSIFEKDIFKEFIELKTSEDGSDLGSRLAQLFEALNKPRKIRSTNLDEHINQFPYINGQLFTEQLPIASFNSKMRNELLNCCSLNWSKISPAIFGSMFQSVMSPERRRNLGAHYTSEKNILKLIKPLFLDDLYKEFEKVKTNTKQLREFHKKLSKLKFLDPACGCGNFLVITYRELRLLELKILKIYYKKQQTTSIESLVYVDVDQFYGIEYEEFPARIAEVAMWLIDHQMNMIVSEEFGQYFARLPLKKSAIITNDNALRIDWNDIISNDELNYILGNPPFVGSKLLNTEQRAEMAEIFYNIKNGKILDYVGAWYLKATQYIENTSINVAFVSTNSITQGEQVSVLWGELLKNYGIKIHFAHTTFKWSNEARGKAAVYCVIIGFANYNIKDKQLFNYTDIKGDPTELIVKNINPYLANAKDLIILRRDKPIIDVPEMSFGNMPLDGGNLLFTQEEKDNFIKVEPKAEKYFLPLISAKEFLNNKKRWCLWLEDVNPNELRELPKVLERVEAVKQFRLASIRKSTVKKANFPSLFGEIRDFGKTFIVVPRVSSENRKYIPMGFFDRNNIVSDTMLAITNGTLYNFGVLISEMHMAWVKYTCGRLKSDYRYSKNIVYNNYPWPKEPSKKNKNKVKEKAQKVLDIRDEFPESSLADLYDPLTMPSNLVKAHQELDKAVDLCYRPQAFKNETSRIEYLFELYNEYTAPLFKKDKKRKIRKK